MDFPRRHAPATERNRQPLLDVLARVLSEGPRPCVVLEVASGTGEHAVWFGEKLPHVVWQPSDVDPGARASVDAWREEAGLSNVRPAVALDAASAIWPVTIAHAVVCINMIHISPIEACDGLLQGASRILTAGAPLVLYGPFRVHGEHTAPSNERFDHDLRARNPSWGVRDLDDVVARATTAGFDHAETVAMPANNMTVIFRRREPS
jgi:hypothetical protein